LPGASRLSKATRAWYRTWARSPQALRFAATDWQRLHMLAGLVERYFADPSKELMSEIRLNEAKLGATPEDRMRLRWRIVDQADKQEEAARPRRRSRQRSDPRHLAAVPGSATLE